MISMTFVRYEISNKATFALGEQALGRIFHFIRLRHLGVGAADVEITFQAGGAIAQVILSPPAGTYPQEVQMEIPSGVDLVRIKCPGETVEVTAWR